jgi:LEA14-like dessication related protein
MTKYIRQPQASQNALQRRLVLSLPFLGVIGLMLTQPGCNIVPPTNLKAPVLTFSDLSLGDVSIERMRFLVTLNAANPNDSDIPLSNMKFDLTVLDVAVGSGNTVAKDIRVAKLATTQVPIEFVVPTNQLLAVIRRVGIRELGRLPYTLKGSAQWNNGPFTLPFERKGEFSAVKKLSDGLAR